MRWLLIVVGLQIFGLWLTFTPQSYASEFVVYSIYRGLSMGNLDEIPDKDYYVNMGSDQGLREGSILEVLRRVSTYDLLNEQFYRDLTFPIAKLKVIHAENKASVARLDRFLPAANTPVMTPRAVMVGDQVRYPEAR